MQWLTGSTYTSIGNAPLEAGVFQHSCLQEAGKCCCRQIIMLPTWASLPCMHRIARQATAPEQLSCMRPQSGIAPA
jgi:hypothetical protein